MLIEVVHYGLICDVTHSPLASISSNEHTAYGQLCTCSKVLAALLGACRVQYIFFFMVVSVSWCQAQLSVLSHVFSIATTLSACLYVLSLCSKRGPQA